MKGFAVRFLMGSLLFSLTASSAQATRPSVHFYVPTGIAVDADGDLLITAFIDNPTHSVGPGIVRIDPASGKSSVVSSGGNFDNLQKVAVAASGTIVVLDFAAHSSGRNRIIQVDPATGAQTLIADLGTAAATGLAIDSADNIYVTRISSLCCPSAVVGEVVRIDPANGGQSIVFSQNHALLRGVAIDGSDQLFVAHIFSELCTNCPSEHRIILIDPSTGTHTIVSAGGLLLDRFYADTNWAVVVRAQDIDASGNLLVSRSLENLQPDDGAAEAVIKIDPRTGIQTVISSEGFLTWHRSLAIGDRANAVGPIYVADLFVSRDGLPPGDGAIIRVNPRSGVQGVVAWGSRAP